MSAAGVPGSYWVGTYIAQRRIVPGNTLLSFHTNSVTLPWGTPSLRCESGPNSYRTTGCLYVGKLSRSLSPRRSADRTLPAFAAGAWAQALESKERKTRLLTKRVFISTTGHPLSIDEQ